jgi:ABC-type multidrug transport system ATPase subunit
MSQILVSHHLELLLPSANYIVRLLDGRIDAQGTPAELREHGELEGLVAMEESEVQREETVTASEAVEGEGEGSKGKEQKPKTERGPAKKFVQGESNLKHAAVWIRADGSR